MLRAFDVAMSAEYRRRMIVEYWFRVIIGSDISIENIVGIALKFAKDYEQFHADLSHTQLKIENEGRVVVNETYSYSQHNAFGIMTAKPGNVYHWKIKIVESTSNNINIGIIEADKYAEYLQDKTSWWSQSDGYSYWATNGRFYHESSTGKPYGENYRVNDIVHVYLDLSDGVNELSFGKNEKRFGKAANVKDSTNHKLGIAMSGEMKLELIL